MPETITEAQPFGLDRATRPDSESAERINEAIKLELFCGAEIAAYYMERHCIAPSTILRILMTRNRRQ